VSANRFRYVLLTVAIVAVSGAYYFGVGDYLTIENMLEYKSRLGWLAPLAFVLAFIIGELLQVPSVLWILFAGLIWPWFVAFPLALVAAMFAATTAFLIARYFLGDQFHEKLPATFQNLNDKLAQQPIRAITILRLTTFLHPAMHWVLAASSVNLLQFLVGTLLGILPATLAIVLVGELFLNWWDRYSLAIVGVVLAMIVLSVWIARRRRSELVKQPAGE